MSTVIMKSTLGHLTRVYLWPKSQNSTTTAAYLTLVTGSFLLIGSLLRLFMALAKNQNIDMIATGENITSQFGVMYFASIFIMNRTSIMKIVSDLSDFHKFGKPPHFDDRNKELDKAARLFRGGLYAAIVVLSVWPAIYTGLCTDEVCGLVQPTWLPFDYGDFPVKQMICIWQCYCCLVTYGAAGMISMAMLETMEHLVVRIQHLKMLLVEVMEEKSPYVRHKLIGRWVEYHVFILGVGKEMNRSYHVGLVVHTLVAGVLFGFIGHTIIENAFTIDSMALFSGWFASFSIVCVGGQHLIDESLSVGTAIYNTRWYQHDTKFQKNIIPIVMRSRRPILIYAGPFTFLSLLLILAVLQTAYTYINLLNATS